MELSGADVRRDPISAALDVRVPTIHLVSGGERDGIEDALLAPYPPSPRNERSGAEAGTWQVVDNRIDKLVGE